MSDDFDEVHGGEADQWGGWTWKEPRHCVRPLNHAGDGHACGCGPVVNWSLMPSASFSGVVQKIGYPKKGTKK